MMTFLLFVLGLGLMLVGAELLVRGASSLASSFAVPPLVIGLTIVAFGTSAPELAVSIGAAWSGRADISLGNVVGSNIFNVLLILGLSAVIAPLTVSRKLVRLDVPVMIGASLLIVALGWNGVISRWEGALLVALGLAYMILQVREGRRESRADSPADLQAGGPSRNTTPWRLGGMILGGLILLVLGSRWLVDGAATLARTLGISELVIGLTVIAADTSLPELATSIMASLRGERDIAVGNVVGSNIFNILWVLGVAAGLSSRGVGVSGDVMRFDIPIMVGAAVACLPIFFTGLVIARWEGALFCVYYVAYTSLLILSATQSPSSPTLRTALLGFVAPLTLLTLGILALRARRRN